MGFVYRDLRVVAPRNGHSFHLTASRWLVFHRSVPFNGGCLGGVGCGVCATRLVERLI